MEIYISWKNHSINFSLWQNNDVNRLWPTLYVIVACWYYIRNSQIDQHLRQHSSVIFSKYHISHIKVSKKYHRFDLYWKIQLRVNVKYFYYIFLAWHSSKIVVNKSFSKWELISFQNDDCVNVLCCKLREDDKCHFSGWVLQALPNRTGSVEKEKTSPTPSWIAEQRLWIRSITVISVRNAAYTHLLKKQGCPSPFFRYYNLKIEHYMKMMRLILFFQSYYFYFHKICY